MRYERRRPATSRPRRPLRHDRRARRGRDRRDQGRPSTATSTSAGPAASGCSRPRASTSARSSSPRRRTTSPGATTTARDLYITALTSVYRLRLAIPGIRPTLRRSTDEQEPRSRRRRSPTSSCPTRTAYMHRLSELQGDDVHGAACSAAASTARASASTSARCCSFHEWCSVAFTQLVTVLPNELHDVFKLKIATGAHWTFLADEDLEVQTAARHPRVHRPAPRGARAAHADALARPRDRQGLRRLLVLGPPVARTSCGTTSARSSSASSPTSTRRRRSPRAE